MSLKSQLEAADGMISNPFLRVLYVAQVSRAASKSMHEKAKATGEGGSAKPAPERPEGKSHDRQYIGAAA
jgi:hypothetical protein